MEALTSFSTKIFASNGNRSPPLSALTQQGRSVLAFSPSPAFKKLHFDRLVSFRSIAKSHVASDAAQVSTGLENAVAGNTQMERSKTAHVKFQLQKECMFGDEFLLVGDDPILGLWNPTDAVPMNWSEGHIWSVELDVPIESTIQFKFILKQGTGDMIWQPGSDRIFKSWESKGTVVIAEDWENPEAQKITEEQITDQIEEVHQREMLIVPMSNRLSFSGHFSEAS
ncbi:cyclomaltodextrin glucanotransferase isoform X2 [Manihot esculenta]|uniref:CBM20 domain-containing protein n=1 Tax=Manihot esculenta TaxID=3983 RepID=A0A2C9WD54_MANES|nr:cyclomaltodextrin glucanotransferase isoform X2 [Manihot esculenta]OAY57746.1 hypothetical protein MANES_02G120500v8 [Manihot esculenta]